jgi:hypothetical protein
LYSFHLLFQKKADDPSVMSGSLKVSTDGGKTWNKRWFVVHTDFVLYSFKAKRVSDHMEYPKGPYWVLFDLYE